MAYLVANLFNALLFDNGPQNLANSSLYDLPARRQRYRYCSVRACMAHLLWQISIESSPVGHSRVAYQA
jgi:hypothetical protein